MFKNEVLDQLDEHAILYLRDIKRKKDATRKDMRALERQIVEVSPQWLKLFVLKNKTSELMMNVTS